MEESIFMYSWQVADHRKDNLQISLPENKPFDIAADVVVTKIDTNITVKILELLKGTQGVVPQELKLLLPSTLSSCYRAPKVGDMGRVFLRDAKGSIQGAEYIPYLFRAGYAIPIEH